MSNGHELHLICCNARQQSRSISLSGFNAGLRLLVALLNGFIKFTSIAYRMVIRQEQTSMAAVLLHSPNRQSCRYPFHSIDSSRTAYPRRCSGFQHREVENSPPSKFPKSARHRPVEQHIMHPLSLSTLSQCKSWFELPSRNTIY